MSNTLRITEKEIISAWEKYWVVAKQDSILYFIMLDMTLIDFMYQ